MFPVKLGYEEAVRRIRLLLDNGHDAEAFLASMFTFEKTLYRTLRLLVISAGFPSNQADRLMNYFRGIENIKQIWPCFDPRNKPLSAFLIPSTLETIKNAQEKRNNLVHGKKVYKLSVYRDMSIDVLNALDDVRRSFETRYGSDGWSPIKKRIKNALHTDPRVRVTT